MVKQKKSIKTKSNGASLTKSPNPISRSEGKCSPFCCSFRFCFLHVETFCRKKKHAHDWGRRIKRKEEAWRRKEQKGGLRETSKLFLNVWNTGLDNCCSWHREGSAQDNDRRWLQGTRGRRRPAGGSGGVPSCIVGPVFHPSWITGGQDGSLESNPRAVVTFVFNTDRSLSPFLLCFARGMVTKSFNHTEAYLAVDQTLLIWAIVPCTVRLQSPFAKAYSFCPQSLGQGIYCCPALQMTVGGEQGVGG